MTARYKCVCAYDGTDFKGWQSQACGRAIQDFIEARLEKILKIKTRIHASGRTDAGVHARAQVFHFDASWKHSTKKLLTAIRSGPPSGVSFIYLKKVKDDFHGRYSVKGKRYIYYIYEGWALPFEARYAWSYASGKLNLKAMRDAAKIFVGTHDFTAFSANRRQNDDPIKTLTKLSVSRKGKILKIETEGSGYMYKMVRLLVGALVEVGAARLTLADLQNHLDKKERNNLVQPAPACGLFLDKVFY